MGIHNYVATVLKPSSVFCSVSGNFTGDDVLNLIIGKGRTLEVFLYGDDSLEHMTELSIKGNITLIQLFRPSGEPRDLLFLATSDLVCFVLEWDPLRCQILIRSKQKFVESTRIFEVTVKKQIGLIDPDCKMIALHLFFGALEVIPLAEKGQMKEASYIPIEHHQVLDIKFLFGRTIPTVAVLHRISEGKLVCDYKVSTYEFILKDKGIRSFKGPWSKMLNTMASLLIPVPLRPYGILIIGPKRVEYFNGYVSKVLESVHATTNVYGRLSGDNLRYLLADKSGFLHMIVVTQKEGKFIVLNVESVGESSVATTISSLGNEVVYVGASYGDSQLIRLRPLSDGNGFCIEVLERYVNLGPITDFTVVESARHGKGTVATCSNSRKDQSFNVWRYGFGIEKLASEQLEGITGMWSLQSDRADLFLVVSFVAETRILEINSEGELEETEIKGFSCDVRTLFSHEAMYHQLVQVTSSSVRLVSSASKGLLDEWKTSKTSINVATANLNQVLLAGHDFLVCLEIGNGVLKEIKYKAIQADVSCLDITPIGEDLVSGKLAAVGMWTTCVQILLLPHLQLLNEVHVGVVPHSVLLCEFEKISYLLCTLRDGHLLHFLLNQNNGLLTDRTKVSLGCQPISLCTFSSSNTPYVFAASRTPTVLYSSNEKLLYGSVVDLKEVRHLCPLNSAYFPDSLAFVEEDRLSIGTMDYPRFTIHSIPLEEEAVKVCHQDYSRTYALCCRKYIKSNGEEIGRVILLNDQTYEFESDYFLDQHEYGTSVISCSFADDSNVYYCIGTGYDDNNGHLIDKGRVLVLSAKDRKLQLIAEEQISQGVGSLDAFQGKLIVLTVDEVRLYKWLCHADHQLKFECKNMSSSANLSVESRGNVIVVAGASRQPFLLTYKQEKSAIEELDCHHLSLWSSAITILDDEVYLGSDFGCDIFTVGKNSERGGFEVVGKYHLGERVCRFRGGSLLMGMFGQIPTCIFGTDSGWIGIVASVPQNQYSFLFKLQSVLRKVVKYKGGLSHQKWISNISAEEEEVEDARNFLDGDLIESFLDLSPSAMDSVSKAMKESVEALKEKVKVLRKFRQCFMEVLFLLCCSASSCIY